MREPIEITGLTELFRGLEAAGGPMLKREVMDSIKGAGNIIKTDAEGLAATRIRNITEPWTRMRLGWTSNVVYIAPRERGTNSPNQRRPGFGLLLLEQMDSALGANKERVEEAVVAAVEEVNANAGLISHLHALT